MRHSWTRRSGLQRAAATYICLWFRRAALVRLYEVADVSIHSCFFLLVLGSGFGLGWVARLMNGRELIGG
jgi:hypothetical protein